MKLLSAIAAAALLATLPAAAQTAPPTPAGTLIDFRVDVQRSVVNDLGRATAHVELTGADAADVAHRVNAAIAGGLATAKAQPGVTVKTGNSHTYPVYGKGGRTIESWRTRSEIALESRDAAALSALLGKLQSSQLAVSQVGFAPAPETRRAAEDDAALEAIAAFQAKAARYAAALKKPYRIRSMNIGSGYAPPQPLFRGAMMAAADAAPLPAETGESTITVNLNGQIELID
ncbi:SIMPL domain-containing protein [Sulfurisoma sediminicola]|uniref:Putative secreted protein n=1 Tax=Sulfurisoma sediminicola TaxID=1381557 RepID=A0A497XCE0_9PROT|nr:SIMPL domain-containing protein [Sulfurisoma sediminicola]RLJ64581.1 putative secreted protein [Sulfurisoma sediminicola]